MGRKQAKIGDGPLVKALREVSKALDRSVKLAGNIANPTTTTTTTV